MADTNKIGTGGAGILGAIVGAGAAIAATKILQDKDKREKILHTAKDLKQKASTQFDKLKNMAEDKADEVAGKAEKQIDKLEKKTDKI